MLVALRSNEWKLAFAEQRAHGMEVDLFETADHEGMNYKRWRLEHLFLPVPAQQYVGQSWARSRNSRRGRRPATRHRSGAGKPD
jgi:hypothetical protein